MSEVTNEGDDARQEIVLVNEEEQHSLWPASKTVPAGWRQVYGPAAKAECLQYVDENWKDITPLSVRKRLALNS
jgi:MbtH protein